jgi:hypothetical protein
VKALAACQNKKHKGDPYVFGWTPRFYWRLRF